MRCRVSFSALMACFLVHSVRCFAYSCDEVLSTFTNWNQLEHIYFEDAEGTKYSFASFAVKDGVYPYLENDGTDPWKIVGDEPITECNQEFTLILNSDDSDINLLSSALFEFPFHKDGDELSGIYVVPTVGMWFSRMSAGGEGNVTLYSGAGTGEEEERYLLQSWSCESWPDYIYVFESVITLDVDDNCFGIIICSSDLPHQCWDFTFTDFTQMFIRTQGLLWLVTGRSGNLQNRKGIENIAYILIGEWCNFSMDDANVNLNMDLTFDSENNGSLGVMKTYSGDVTPYYNGTYVETFTTNYLEMRWNPKLLQSSDISRNQDNIYVEINLSPKISDYECPDGYSLVSSTDNQHGCFIASWLIPPAEKFNFSDAAALCESKDDSLPIVTSDELNSSLRNFSLHHLGVEAVWLGIVCNTGDSCSGSDHFALDNSKKWIRYKSEKRISYYICARSAIPTFTVTSTPLPTESFPSWAIILIVVCIFFVCGIAIRSMKAKALEEQLEKEKKLNELMAHKLESLGNHEIDQDWEIERSFVSIEYASKLGQGAFGSVFQGRILAKNIPSGMGRSIVELLALTNNKDTVAVKMLHENADAKTEADFLAEIDLMKQIGYHERLVNMLACVTISRPILLICEFCANGDLLEFLRKRRTYMLEQPEDTSDEKVVTFHKQLLFAIQTAYGLEYLSSKGFVHRDIAARNIMVDAQESCKIGDFGLGRMLGMEDENYHAPGRKVPLKWMAPVAIDKYYFSAAADVWSFGVLLFEIVTLGGTPYAGWPATELLDRLKRGERMERPDNCSEILFEVMCDCWAKQPSDRPSFENLRRKLGEILEDVNENDYYLRLNAQAHYYVLE